jgi:hypothetical protein
MKAHVAEVFKKRSTGVNGVNGANGVHGAHGAQGTNDVANGV